MIIGLTGRAFCGKDTVGAYLARAHNFSLYAFADLMERRIEKSLHTGDGDIVITDVRFWTEAAMINRLGGQVWRIHRPDGETTRHNAHISEQEMDCIPVHYTLSNDGTLEQLYKAVDAALFWHCLL